MLRFLLRLFGLAVLAFVAGFFVFVFSLDAKIPEAPSADAIVALTGGSSRLDAASGLMREHAGERLLISGVDESVTREEMKERLLLDQATFDCCVDLGRAARDTHGNAEETARWANARRYRSLLVVTANYHMPRTLLELGRALPGVELLPYPVAPDEVKLSAWWRDGPTFRILAGEYLKYVAALVRLDSAGAAAE